jgi:hypothetical protein
VPPPSPQCPYCLQTSALVTGAEVYPHRADLADKQFYLCEPCQARVGCHPDGRPLGTLADGPTREARTKAHYFFDLLCNRKLVTARAKLKGGGVTMSARLERQLRKEYRAAGYAWLAGQLDIPISECHMAMMTEEQCLRVVEICRPFVGRGDAPARAEGVRMTPGAK